MNTDDSAQQLNQLIKTISSCTDYGERTQHENAVLQILNNTNFLSIVDSFLLGSYPVGKLNSNY